jgi:dTMP kinase
MIGDRKFDMQGACEAGVYPIGVSYGYGSREELLSSGAKTVCESVEALRHELLGDVPKQRGVFITFEGSDGCGKSTQLRLLKNYLESCGLETVATREPGGCPISERIREVLLDVKSMGMTDECEALLFAAARSQHVNDTIEPALRDGKVVLCDRFVDSSAAYQGGGRQIGVDKILRINEPAVDGTMPDLTVYLDIDHRKAMERRCAASEPDRLEMEAESFHARVEDAYHQLIAKDPDRFAVVNAEGSREDIAAEIAEKVLSKLL